MTGELDEKKTQIKILQQTLQVAYTSRVFQLIYICIYVKLLSLFVWMSVVLFVRS